MTTFRVRALQCVSATALLVGTLSAGPGWAQSAPASAPQDDASEVDEVVVTGIRGALRSALATKRTANVMVDAINAEDIADFPDANLAESLQRLPGVSIDRDNGEGRTITVRGLGSDFTRVRLNGVEALSTAGASIAGDSPNRSRGFDFNTFASELFNSLKVQKTASAETEEGSLGATVDLQTGRPLDYSDRRFAFSAQDAYYENGETHNPRVAALASNRWTVDGLGDFGLLASAAFNTRDQTIDSYQRQAGQSDYTYRQATFAGTPNLAAGREIQTRQGFAAPTNTNCNGTLPGIVGVIPGVNITNTSYCDALRGSNAAAYALINSPIGSTLRNNAATGTAAGTTIAPGSLVRIPALPTLNQQDLHQERTGLTFSAQWRPTERTTLSFDGVYSQLDQISTNYQIVPVGLNRNNTQGTANQATFQLSNATGVGTPAQRRALYASCNARAETAIVAGIDCGQQIYGNTPVPLAAGASGFSFNPNNLEPFDYYNNRASVGYVLEPNGLAVRNALIGRPSVRLIDAALSPTGANADYLVVGNVDMRSAADEARYTTFFQQGTLNLQHEFSDTLRMQAVYGESRSVNKSQGSLVEFTRLNSGSGTAGDGYFVYDARGGGDMPSLDFGFDVANPANWDVVKGFSAIRYFERTVDNHYEGGNVDFAWDASEYLTLKAGYQRKRYTFFTTALQRESARETLNPSLREAGTTIDQVGTLRSFGQGLELPEGTPTSFYAPDLDAFRDLFDFECNCVNKWNDWRISEKFNFAQTFEITETDEAYFLQADFNVPVFGRDLRGNIGVRQANTVVDSNGFTNRGRAISAGNDYDNTLPSMNLAYEITDDVIIRLGVAKVMARPLLGNLAPSVTAFSVPNGLGATSGGSITIGNPQLSPFTATNYDLSVEWYFQPDALFSVAIFDKEVESFPQTLVGEGTLSSILDSSAIAELRAEFEALAADTTLTAAARAQAQNQVDYINADKPFGIRQFRDAPGGYIRGVEVNYQQNLTFLPWYFENLGVQANYTHLESELNYILTPAPLVTGVGPFTGASPDAFNVTVFYEVPKFSARVSAAYRADYVTQYPIASGTTDPGFSDSPLVNDFLGSEKTLNVDASVTYKLTEIVTLTAEALNLTNQTTNRWGYADDRVTTNYGSTGRQFFVGARAVF
ncbi:TonB-dependent receptor [Brevundimonas sp. LM2]|uniref:TonB-dependent receptor domain-containing protein n=1 Tax=Brevundimonas sp. LM2 TaxID=1938605 RepID=UPI0009839567|nr:TonB-dependent receptor [Brevundimonas sp. LM2]AQR61917.1 TonB-dependent receptor [Brevundimonas sp. LM2]